MKKIIAAFAAAVLMITAAGSLLAHHSLGQFDTTTAVTVKGIIVGWEQVNPHSILFLEEKGTDGKPHRWAVEGPSVIQLGRRGINKDIIKVGDVVEACGYALKDGSQRTLGDLSGRLLTGEQLVTADGQKRSWSDYGHHKCLGADYRDLHSK